MIKKVNKISIIGGSDTGKTTLATNLGKELNLPVCHIDGIHHLENWRVRDKEERDKILLEKINEPKWVIDGTYRSTLKQRLQKSEYIIYLDYSPLAHVRGVMGRYLKNHGKEKQEIPGCKEQMSLEFFFVALNWRKNKRESILEALEGIDKDRILVFKNRKKLNKWYKEQFGKKIEV